MALENILSQEIVQKLGWTLLHFVWQATAVALLLAILLAVLRKSSANLRYIIACAALGLIVLLPIATMQLIPVSTPQPTVDIEPAPAPVIMPVQEFQEIPAVEMSIPEGPVQHENAATAFNASWKQRAADLFEPALPYIVSAWLLGVFGLSLWHLGGWAQLQRLRKKMVKPVDDSLCARLRRLSERLRVKRAVQLVESALVQVPTVVGWLRPVILLPASALTGLSSEQLEALLAHELAHIRRHDYLINMLQTLVETLGFYHPAVWWISHKIRIERENCCDDLAVSISGDRVCYARALTSMEEIRGRRGDLAVAATGGNLFGRIRRLVGKDTTDSSRASWIPSVITILLIAIIVIPTTLALTAHDKTEHSAVFLLDKMLEHHSRVKNLQYVAETNIWRDPVAEESRIEDQIKSMRERGIPERQLERIRQSITESPESRYQILKCTIDDEEHVKIEQTGGTYDSSGKKVPREDKHIWAWNGVLATDFSQRSGFPGSATIKDKPQVATKLGHPWRSFTGIFCKFLEETIAAERPVDVEKLKDGTYRIAFDYKTSRYAAIAEPSKGYTCSLRENYNEQGQLNSRTTATYEEVADGIWFPVSGQRQEYTPEGTVRYRSIAKSSQIRINNPAFNNSYFDVDMPEGTAVRDEVQNKQYVVGSKRVYDLDERRKSSAETEEIDPNSWQEKFYSIYRLEDGQVLKRIAPPFIPERTGYLKSIQPGRYSPNTPLHLVSQYFNWDGKLSIRGASMGGGIRRLNTILGSVIGLGNRQYDIPSEILSADMSGDWIVRKDTLQEELLQALEQIVKDETSRDIDFVRQNVETEVIIAEGKYNFQLLPNITDGQYVLISTNNTDTYTGGGGGSGTLGKFLRWVGNRVGMNIIDETESEGVELSWRNHDSSELSRLNHDSEPYNQRLNLLLNNLILQTGLTFSRETATVEKWFISEKGTIEAPQKADTATVPEGAMLTHATTDAENNTQQEQLNKILEKFSDGASGDNSSDNSKSVRESVENYIAAAVAGEDEKAAEYAYPDTAVAAQTKDMREILQGQDIKIVAACIGEWNSLAITPIIQADHVRTGSIVFHLKKVILSQNVHWLIDDIDLETLDTIGNEISYFINNVPDAKTIIISADTYANKQTDAPVESDEGRIEGRIIDINTAKGIPGVQLAVVPDSSPEWSDRFVCTSAEDGTFAIGGLQTGEYLLQGDFPSVDVDVVSGRCTNDVLIGVRRGETVPAPIETTAEQQRGGQIMIGMSLIEIPADTMKDVFEPNENLSSGLLVRHGHEITGRLLRLAQERKDVELLITNAQMLMMNNGNAAMTITDEEKVYIGDYESAEGEPGKLTAQNKFLEAGWKYKFKAEILESGEKVHMELAIRQQKPTFETLQYRPGYDYQIPSPPEIFVTEMTAKNGEPVVIGRLRPGEPALCLIVTPSALVPERLPEPLLGKQLPEPDNIQNIDSLKQAEGKPTLICFWDMNQRPSRNIIENLARREKELAEKNIAVLLVHTLNIEPAKLKEWLDSRKISFTCGSIENDAKKVLFRWGVRAQPWLILTDEEGVVRAEGFNIEQLDEKLHANGTNDVLSRAEGANFTDNSRPGESSEIPQEKTDAQRKAEVFGRVLQDGRNVVWTRVIARIRNDQLSNLSSHPQSLYTRTDVNGLYRFVDLPAGKYSISVMSPKGNLSMAKKQINLESGYRTELNFGDEEGFTLTGTVTFDGEAVEIAGVWISLPNKSTKWGWTDRNGNFRITGIPSGQYVLRTSYDERLDPKTFTRRQVGKHYYDKRQITIENDRSVDIRLEDRSKKENPAGTSKPASVKARILHFPEDRAVGDLKVRDARPDEDWDRGYLSLPGWALLGRAQGDVSIPAGEELRLEVSGDVTDFSFLAELKPNDLQALLLSHSKISDEDLAYLNALTGLLALHLGSTPIEGTGLAHLTALTSLKELSLFNTQVSDAGLEHLSSLKSLKRLNLYVTQVRGPGLKHLQSLTSLVLLDLAATPITDAALAHVAEMTWLKELQIYDTDITDKGLAHLESLRSLEMLILGNAGLRQEYSPISDEGLIHLKELASLKDLYLLRTRVTDAGMAHLSDLKTLEALDLTETRITGKGLQYLKEMTSLRDMLLDGEGISEADVKDLEKALPDCKISVRTANSTGSVPDIPMLAKSAAPSAEDKSHVQVDLSVVEVFSDSKFDRETTIAIENLLSGKITLPDSPNAADLLRKAAGATAKVKDESAGDKRVAQEEFNTLLDILVSRGFVKILMNPTLEVVDGQTAKISSKQKIRSTQDSLEDSIQITPNVLEDGNIILQVEATLSSQSISRGKEQPPIINKRQISTRIRLSPGESGIIGGMKKTEKYPEAGINVKDSQEQTTEVLVILTPTITNAPAISTAPKAASDEAIKIYELSHIQSLQLAELLQSLQPEGKRVRISADEQTNRLIIQATAADHKKIEELISQLDVAKDQIMFDIKVLTVSDEFMKYIGLDPNSVANSKDWSAYLVHSTDDSASFVIDQLHAELIIKSAATHKNSQVLTAPQVLALSGKKFEIHTIKPDSYMLRSPPSEPNALSGEPESKSNRIELGTTIRLTPTLTPDRKNVDLDFEWEYRRLRGIKEYTGPDGKVQKIPQVDVDRIKTPCTIPDGKTLLITGKKIIEQKKEPKKPRLADLPLIGGLFSSPAKTEETRNLLILIKPNINPPKKDPPKPTPIDPNDPLMQPIDPNDPLVIKLEEKFKR